MNLQRGTMFYRSVLESKRQALFSAVELANALDTDIAKLKDSEHQRICQQSLN